MDAAANCYWSIEACGWVRSPARADVPAQRTSENGDEVVDLDAEPADAVDLMVGPESGADVPVGVPI